jgi:hypothetical protein
MKYFSGEHENNNILKSSVFCLSECMRSVLLAPNLGTQFQEYIGETILRLHFNLRESSRLSPYAEVLAYKLRHISRHSGNDNEYQERVRQILFKNRSEFMIKFDRSYFADLSQLLFDRVLGE